MFLHPASLAPQEQMSVQYNLLDLHLQREVSQADLLQPHFTNWSRVSGAGGNFVIIGTNMSPSRFQP